MPAYAWTRLDVDAGLSFVRVDETASAIEVEGHEVIASGGSASLVRFRVELDSEWRTRLADIWITTDDLRASMGLEADALGRWRLNGARAPQLDGCTDVDIAATPFTNTFPIRRLGLGIGQSSTVAAAWVSVPELQVERLEQQYTRLSPAGALDRYEYRDPRFGKFELTVDDKGVVLEYGGFARRVSTPGAA
jgi:uncharacterized protein